MKKLIFVTIIIFINITGFTQLPEKISYQAVIRDSGNNLLINTLVGLRLSVLKDSENGSVAYNQSFLTTTNENGLVSLEFGGNSEGGDVNWAKGPFFLKVEVDPAGGTDYTISGVNQILTVPYAIYAEKSKSFDGFITENQIIDLKNYLTEEKDPMAVRLTDNQEIKGNKTFLDGINAGNNTITNVANPEYDNDAVNKAYVDELERKVENLENILIENGLFKLIDIENNVYEVVKIGNQLWMSENLKTTKYNDGTDILNVMDSAQWETLNQTKTAAYCWYRNDMSYKEIYGALYNWYVVETEKLCPVGWHVPTDQEWTDLEDYLIANGYNYDGSYTTDKTGKSLASDTDYWQTSEITGAVGNTDFEEYRNRSGFNGLPAGYRGSAIAMFQYMGQMGSWWSSSAYSEYVWYRYLYNNRVDLAPHSNEKRSGLSVRCIKD